MGIFYFLLLLEIKEDFSIILSVAEWLEKEREKEIGQFCTADIPHSPLFPLCSIPFFAQKCEYENVSLGDWLISTCWL